MHRQKPVSYHYLQAKSAYSVCKKGHNAILPQRFPWNLTYQSIQPFQYHRLQMPAEVRDRSSLILVADFHISVAIGQESIHNLLRGASDCWHLERAVPVCQVPSFRDLYLHLPVRRQDSLPDYHRHSYPAKEF